MTLNRWFVVLASTATLAACYDGVAPPDPNQLTAKWAGSEWVGSAEVGVVQGGTAGDVLYLWANGPISNRTGCLCPTVYRPSDNAITVKVAFKGPGTYLLGPGEAKFQQVVGGDVISATYQTSTAASGILVISDYQGIGNRIEGALSFEAVSNDQYRGFGPKAKLEDGHFLATVKAIPTF